MSFKHCHPAWPAPDPDLTPNVLNKEFFDDLWPLILNENKCEVPFQHEEQFVPERRFNDWMCHSALAQDCFKDYQLPLLVQWRHQYPPLPNAAFPWDPQLMMGATMPPPSKYRARSKSPPKKSHQQRHPTGHHHHHHKYDDIEIILQLQFEKFSLEDEIFKTVKDCTAEPACARWRGLTMSEKEKRCNAEAGRRLKLAADFQNRQYPWYKERPAHERVFDLRESDEIAFDREADWNMLHNIYHFNCRLIILDLGACMGMETLKPWVKYAAHAGIVVVAHDPITFRKLWTLREFFVPCFVQENLENTWQEELEKALQQGLKCAKAANMYKDCVKPFIYVFAEERGSSDWDTFKIMRKRNAVV